MSRRRFRMRHPSTTPCARSRRSPAGNQRSRGHGGAPRSVVRPSPRMVALRRTQKLAAALPLPNAASCESDTALGDWYVNRLTVDRRPLLLLVSSRALLPVLIPARYVSGLPLRLADIVGARLHRLG